MVLGSLESLSKGIAASGRKVDPLVLKEMQSVDTDGDGELSQIEVYNLLNTHVKRERALSRSNKALVVLSVFVLALIILTSALSFVAADLAKQLNTDSDEFHARDSSNVLKSGTSIRVFNIADAPRLSFDYLEQVEKITVLFDKRIHHFSVDSFEWLGKNEIWIHLTNDKFLAKVKDGVVTVVESTATSEKTHLVYAPDYAVNPSTPKERWDSWFNVVLNRMPQTCVDEFSSAFNTPTDQNPQIVLVENPQISRMCFEAHALADPINRGGALEARVANQDHGLQAWELAAIAAADEAVATAQGAGGHAAGVFSFQSIDDLRANLDAYNEQVARLGFSG